MMNFRSSPLIYRAFTLIELLIVIVIIGILATAFIPKITGMQDRARYARVEKDFRDFRAAVFLAQSNTNKPLKDITANQCTSCWCGYSTSGGVSYEGVDFRKVGQNTRCRTNRISALRKIEQAADMDSGSLAGLETDPWGAPYYLDENEGEFGCNVLDKFYSMGPNGLWDGIHKTDLSLSSGGDNKLYEIIPQGCPGAY